MTTKTTTMNIMKKLASTFALAAAAFAAPIVASAAEGDINRIYPCNEGGVQVANGTADDPIRSGGKFYFAVRFLKRDAADNPWRLHHVSTGTELVDDVYDPLAIGIYVSGKLTYAKYCGSIVVNNYTDFIFSYDVKPGDFAMPVVLAVDQDNPKPANETSYKDKSYHFSPTSLSKWAVDDSTEAGEVATQTANFYFKSTAENADYDLRGAGFYVQTLDFSPTAYEVPSSGEEVQATIKLDTTPTNTVRLYVWSLDETQVKVKGTNKSIQFGPDVATDMQTRSVGTIDVVAGKSEYTIRMTAGTAPVVGTTTQIVLNGFGDFSYSDLTDDRYVDYLTADVTVGEPLEPSISFADAEGNANPTIEIEATTNTTVYKEVKLVFSKAYDAADVNVKIKQQIGGVDVPAADDYQANRYFAILTKSDANPTSTAYTDTITMPKGKKEVSFYVFALGSTDALASGVSLVPDVSEEPSAVQDFFAKGTHGSSLLQVTDQKPAIAVTAPNFAYCGDTASVKVTVADNWRDLQPAWNTKGYHVVIEFGGETVYDQDGVQFESKKAKSFDVKIPVEGSSVTGRVYVYDPTHPDDAAEATFAMSVESARAAAPAIYPTSNTSTNRYDDGQYFAESEKPFFCVNLTSDASRDMYAFLVPMDANASNLVACTAKTNGLFISSGTRKSSAATITFLDGWQSSEPMKAKFTVELRSHKDYGAADSAPCSGYVCRSIELVCTNVSPSIVNGSMTLNTSTVNNGGKLGCNVPVGAPVLFTARVNDPSAKDLEATDGLEIQTKWTFTEGEEGNRSTETAYVTVTNGIVSCSHEFGYEGQVQTVTVWARDKDDVAEFGEYEWGEPKYTFTVKTSTQPRVIFCDSKGVEISSSETIEFNETCAEGDNYLYVKLTDRPTGGQPAISEANPMIVNLEWKRLGSRGNLEFVTNQVAFVNKASDTKATQVEIVLPSLNGATAAGTRYLVTASVVSDSLNQYGQKWSEYYSGATATVYVYNMAPEIIDVSRLDGTLIASADGTNTCAAGETFTMTWNVQDVMPDLTNGKFKVSWSGVTAKTESPTPAALTIPTDYDKLVSDYALEDNGRVFSIANTFIFTAPSTPGVKTVRLTVDDGDGGTASWECVLEVEASKDLIVNAYGPYASAQSKYKAAKGVGQGFVAVDGNPATTVKKFSRTFSFGVSAASATIYAWGYPSKETWDDYVTLGSPFYGVYVDNGLNLLKALDLVDLSGQALSPRGNTWTSGAYYDWSTMGGTDATAGDYDNYFYRWVVTQEASDSKSSSSSSESDNDAAPTWTPMDETKKTFTLDEGTEDGNYATVEAEAIFARELYPLDNLGDINADGIPDQIVALYGIGADAAGKIPSDDLTSLSDFNDDADYLPSSSTASSYSSLIPGLPSSWSAGQAFTALLEVRGYHEGLNNAPELVGVSKHKLHPDYNSDDVEARKAARDYSELEMIAWSLVDYDKDWSPERPSDPTKADTDGDGFPDGYEYYFWYRAHVGDPETGSCRRLIGRRYDPRNPGFGTVITSAEIEKIFDPLVAYSGSAKTIDTDNDGLSDMLELALGTNPLDFDTDGDGLPDGWEVMIAGLDPLVTQSYADGLSDTARNTDGDAMAISSYVLEHAVLPEQFEPEMMHAKRNTFATMRTGGDVTVVNVAGVKSRLQWYAIPHDAEVELEELGTFSGYQVTATVDGKAATFFAKTKPAMTDDGLLKSDIDVRTLVDYNDGKALAYPYVLDVSTFVKVEEIADVKSYKVKTAIAAKVANACWIYGKGSARAALGEVADTAAEYGCLALARQCAVEADAEVVAFPSTDRDVAFLHYLCYQEFGFDPRTAWSSVQPLANRWGKTTDGEAESGTTVAVNSRGGYVSVPTRTRDYANYDEFLVYSFFLNNTPDAMSYDTIDCDPTAPADAKTWYAFTTNPNGPTDDLTKNSTNFWGRTSTNGADTDGDGVPDGWELYTMAGPKDSNGAFVFAPPYAGFLNGKDATMPKSYFSPFVASAKSIYTSTSSYLGGGDNNDGLNQFKEFEGTDSIAAYTNVSTTIAHEGSWTWLNKFFPTDPWNADTDGDGVKDGDEKDAFAYGELSDSAETGLFDDGESRCIPGGGLNPCSVDTDCDGLPDGWEKQFAGTTDSVRTDKHSYGMLDGMDGTVFDAYTLPGGPNRDYDHDGLENWQEYLTGTMRCWRYDDPITPLDYIPFDLYFTTTQNADGTVTVTFDAETAAKNMQEAGYLESDDVNEFWYKTLVDSTSPAYNPHLVTDQTPGSHYFTRVTNGWDAAYIDAVFGKSLGVTGAYYWFYDRVDGQLFKETWAAAWKNIGVAVGSDWSYVPKKYACCSPIDADSDRDGMDDYYEVFHGMNPLLGCSGMIKNIGGFDVVYDSLYAENKVSPEAWNTSGDTDKTVVNFWQRKAADAALAAQQPVVKTPRGTGYDFEVFPWLNGLPTADADGDGICNQEESIMALVNPSAAWHHTDPTALWMTDASYTNSLVSMNYRLPVREVTVLLPDASFAYDGKTYDFCRYDGFTAGEEANAFAPFKMDAWKVVGDYNENGWVASFEQNEGFDSDHDGVMDQDELKGKYTTKSDPLDADSPRHRQAMYFQGPSRPSILQTMPFVREYHPLTSQNGRYPDDMEFVQFTVECWVNAESLDDSTIIERAILVGESNADDQEFVRRNFRLGIEGGKWVASFDPNDTKTDSICVFSRDAATTGWTHLAATYDMTRLTLYVNGSQSANVLCGLQPVYSASDIALRTGTDDYGSGRPRATLAMIVGGSVKGYAGSQKGQALDVTNGVGFDAYEKFFKGYVDEIRVWDGARSANEVAGAMKRRFTSEDAASNRESVYDEWIKGDASGNYRGRYSKDASGNGYLIPAELRFHWSFDSIFGAADEAVVAKAPAGFNLGTDSTEDGARARRTRPDGYVIDWWKTVLDGYAATVYDDPAWICWIPNTVTHLPRYDGTTLDSVYWSEDFRGATNGTYRFARTAEPASLWTQALRGRAKMTATEYFAMSSRHHLVTTNDFVMGSNYTRLYEFTGRHLNQSGDDMLALGGAYAKHVDEMWDSQGASSNWAISGSDKDGDGLPDWWEEYAEDMYRDETVAGEGGIDWDTIVIWPNQETGTHMTAGEAYLRDLARGYHVDKSGSIVTEGSDVTGYRQTADLNGNGLPDWWEEIYGIQDEDALADHDNDGLPNYVEYMLSEVFKPLGVVFDPTRADSAKKGVPDYFYKVGELYVGEIFTDHDLVDDSWEDAYGTDYASRRVYDPYEDSDGDGWSNRSENRYARQSMSIVADEQFHYAASDGLVADYPIPTLELTVHYSGSQNSTVEKANIIVQTTTSTNLMNGMDATFKITGVTTTQTSGSTGTGSSSSSSSSTKDAAGTSYTRSIGKWSNRHAIGTLTPGYINQNSLTLEYCYNPTVETYHWEVLYSTSSYTSKSGSRAEYDADRRKYGDGNVALISKGTQYSTLEDLEIRTDDSGQTAIWTLTSANKTIGTIDLTSGAFDLDLGVFAGVYAVNSTNANEKVSLEDQYYRIAYSANLAVGRPRKLYLGQATDGHVREGKNTIIAFADLDGDGAYTAGEPYGCVTDVDVSWRGTAADITLTETTPLMNRVDPINGLDDRTAIWGNQSGNYTNFTTAALVSGGTKNRIRVVREVIFGTQGSVFASQVGPRRVILDTVIDTSVSTDTAKGVYANANSWITEANILATGALDLDWDYLYDEVASKISNGVIPYVDNASKGYRIGELQSVVYSIVIGDEVISSSIPSNCNFATIMPKRLFDTTRQLPVPVAVGSGGIVTVGRPTFKWTMANNVNGYTAFKLKIASKSGSAFSWTSDFQRMPAADENGVYTWSAPVFAGDKPAGATGIFANNQTYTWSISAYNAKFKSDSFVTGGDFLLNVQTNGYDTGTITAKVHYYGPSVVTNSYVTRVYAYESPDFTGTPVAGAVATAFDGTNANCRIIGIPKGTYYVQAFVDSNNNGVWDKWETMGYLCTRDGSTADYLNPVAIEFGSKVGQTDVAVIYMEDADTDRDNLPDAWEYATATAAQRANGTFLNAKGVSTLTSLNGAEIPVNKSLVTDLLFEIDRSATTTAGLAGDVRSALSSSASFAALAMGVSESGAVKYDAATGTLSVNPTVEEGTFAITGVSFDAENGQVSLTLDGDVVAAENVTSTIYTVKTGSTITVKVYRSETLAEEPTLVATKQIVVTGDTLDSSVITVDTDLTASSGFFKVVVE